VDFRVADVTQLRCEPRQFDVVFSNWLLMYLSDEEVSQLVKNALTWVGPRRRRRWLC
jgi:phosphoethanolamine N-methyltransferase